MEIENMKIKLRKSLKSFDKSDKDLSNYLDLFGTFLSCKVGTSNGLTWEEMRSIIEKEINETK